MNTSTHILDSLICFYSIFFLAHIIWELLFSRSIDLCSLSLKVKRAFLPALLCCLYRLIGCNDMVSCRGLGFKSRRWTSVFSSSRWLHIYRTWKQLHFTDLGNCNPEKKEFTRRRESHFIWPLIIVVMVDNGESHIRLSNACIIFKAVHRLMIIYI